MKHLVCHFCRWGTWMDFIDRVMMIWGYRYFHRLWHIQTHLMKVKNNVRHMKNNKLEIFQNENSCNSVLEIWNTNMASVQISMIYMFTINNITHEQIDWTCTVTGGCRWIRRQSSRLDVTWLEPDSAGPNDVHIQIVPQYKCLQFADFHIRRGLWANRTPWYIIPLISILTTKELSISERPSSENKL